MPTVYVASPYGFSAATRGFYDDVLLPRLAAAGLAVADPWADLDGVIAAALAAADGLTDVRERRLAFAAIDERLGAANAAMIERADLVLAILDGVDVDSGTAAEIGYAAALGRRVVGLRLDLRHAGDNEGVLVNLQVEHFIRRSGGVLATTLDDAVAALTAGG